MVELEKELLSQVEIIKSNAREREDILSNQLSDCNEQLHEEIENRVELVKKIENYETQFSLVSRNFLGENESFDISSSDTPNMEENYNQIDQYFDRTTKQNKRSINNTNNNRKGNDNNNKNIINDNNKKNNNSNLNHTNDNNNDIINNNDSVNDSLDNDRNLSFLNNSNEDLLENYVLEEERELNLESRQNNINHNSGNNNNNYDNLDDYDNLDNNNINDDDDNDNNNDNNNSINYNCNNNNNKMIIENESNGSNEFSIIFQVCLLLEKKLETIKNNQKKSIIRKSHENGEIALSEKQNFTEILTSALTSSLEKTKINFSDDEIVFQSSLKMIKRFSNVLFSLSDSLQFPLSNERFSESVNESILSLTRNNIRYENII